MTSKTNLNELAMLSQEIRRLTLKRLKELPEGFMNWRLNNTAMSFAHLAKHIIDVDEMLFTLLNSTDKTFAWEMGSEEAHVNINAASYEALLRKLEAFGNKRFILISELNDDKIKETIKDTTGNTMTLWWFLMHKVLEHETYHRGQIAAYLKVLNGEQ